MQERRNVPGKIHTGGVGGCDTNNLWSRTGKPAGDTGPYQYQGKISGANTRKQTRQHR